MIRIIFIFKTTDCDFFIILLDSYSSLKKDHINLNLVVSLRYENEKLTIK